MVCNIPLGDGFMLNVCSVLQLLSVRIKLERVYPLYTFQPGTWLSVREETRLYFNNQEAQDWLEALSEFALVTDFFYRNIFSVNFFSIIATESIWINFLLLKYKHGEWLNIFLYLCLLFTTEFMKWFKWFFLFKRVS